VDRVSSVTRRGDTTDIEELHALLAKIITRIMRLLTKQGFFIEGAAVFHEVAAPPKSKARPTSLKRIGKARFCPCKRPHAPTASRSGRERDRKC
jgi:hypothetical protein